MRCITRWSRATLAYGAWRDGGLTVHDVSDPAKPRLLVHRNWSPPFGGGTHSPLPLPDRDLLLVGDEATQDNGEDGIKNIWVFDVRVPANPVSIATMPQPAEADYRAKGAKFGPHNLHENRPGSFQSSSLVFATWYNAGVRAFDISRSLSAARGRPLRAGGAGAHDRSSGPAARASSRAAMSMPTRAGSST